MTPEQDTDPTCISLGVHEEQDRIISREVGLFRQGKLFSIFVGTGDYIKSLRPATTEQDNFPNVYPLEDIADIATVCKQLSQVPFHSLEPYLTLTEEPPI